MARLVKLRDTFNSPVLEDIHLLLPPDVSSPPPEAYLGSFSSMCAYCGATNVELLQCGRCRTASMLCSRSRPKCVPHTALPRVLRAHAPALTDARLSRTLTLALTLALTQESKP